MNWKLHGKDDYTLQDGDILRTQSSISGIYYYAIASGNGFGSKPIKETPFGNAIFVKYVSTNFDDVILKRETKNYIFEDGDRWERFWQVERLIE